MTEQNKGRLAAKLSRAMAACAHVPKDGQNQHFGYRYASVGAVLGAVNDALVAEGLAATVVPDIVSDVPITTARGATEHLVTVRATVSVHDGETGESLTFCGLGSGQDAGDKAVAKAQSAAIKYAWLLTFSIDTNEDADDDRQEQRPPARAAAPARSAAPGRPAPPVRPPAAAPAQQAAPTPIRPAVAPQRAAQATESAPSAEDEDGLAHFSRELLPPDAEDAALIALRERWTGLAFEAEMEGLRPPTEDKLPSNAAALAKVVESWEGQVARAKATAATPGRGARGR